VDRRDGRRTVTTFLENLPWWIGVLPWCVLVLLIGSMWLRDEDEP
jgi:hypothetical protein